MTKTMLMQAKPVRGMKTRLEQKRHNLLLVLGGTGLARSFVAHLCGLGSNLQLFPEFVGTYNPRQVKLGHFTYC